MRPVRLSMQAFGSYARKTQIDFMLPRQNLFLITGDTGAGKTTIFDAIVYALYGEASSGVNKKDGPELQSHYAPQDVVPYVEFAFTEWEGENQVLYTIRRTLRYIRPAKRRGAKDQLVKETVELTMPDGSIYPQKETDEKIIELVGLTKVQFMQVAMIAQGEFMDLLRADSNTKREIFRKLFGTELFRRIVEELQDRCRDRLASMEEIRIITEHEISRIRIPESEPDTLQALRTRILAGGRPNIAALEQLITELEQLCARLDTEVEALTAQAAQCAGERDRKRDAYVGAQELAGLYEQMERAAAILEGCASLEQNMQEKERLSSSIRSAYGIRAVHVRLADARRAQETTENGRKQQEEAIPQLMETLRKAREKAGETGREAEKQLAAYTKAEEQTRRALEILAQIRLSEEAVRTAAAELEKAQEEKRAADLALTELEKQEKSWRLKEEELAGTEQLLTRWEVHSRDIQTLKNELAELIREEQETASLALKAQKCADEYGRVREAYRRKKEEYDSAREGFLDAQAGWLASTLKEGEPCPVCGSREHPAPCASPEEHRELTRELVEKLAQESSELEQARTRLSGEAGAAQQQLTSGKEHLKQVMNRVREQFLALGQTAPDPLTAETAAGPVQMLEKTSGEQGAVLRQNLETLRQVRTLLQDVDERREALQGRARTAGEAAADREQTLAVRKAQLAQQQSLTAYATEQEAQAALSSARMKKQEADQADQMQKQRAEADAARLEQARALYERYTQELPQRIQDAAMRKQEYEQALSRSGLSEDAWMQLTRTHEAGEAEALQQEIEAFRSRRAAAGGVMQSTRETIGSRPRPDTEALKTELDAADAGLDALQKMLEEKRETRRTDRDVLAHLVPRMKEHSGIAAEYERVSQLYERLAGKRTGFRMDLETYVQRYYLQRILTAANVRLLEMSDGQFELRMMDEDRSGEGKNRGLDLMVYSTVTGKEREIRTLSGGESFMAALSLALGMADQIQENASAVQLEMMFIDEGFGSLDDHARSQAVRVLQELAGSSRLIGIISHVTELKQELEDQLIVSKDEEGSRVRWQLS